MVSGLGWQRLVLGLALASVSCDSKKPTAEAPAGSASAVPALSTSWRQDPGRLLSQGDDAPNFEGIAHTGGRVQLSDFLERPAVVLFYAGNTAPESATLVEQVRDHWLHLNPLISMVFGISADPNVLHRDFATERDLPFLLISDADGSIARAFGVSAEALPATFIVGSDRKIVRVLERSAAGSYGTELRKTLSPPQ